MPQVLKRTEGDVLKINLNHRQHTYCLIAEDPLLIFFDVKADEQLSPSAIVGCDELFRIWVQNQDVQSGNWEFVGNVSLTKDQRGQPHMFKQDIISGKLSIHHNEFSSTNFERPAKLSECIGLERAAVWDAKHVEDRLFDHFAGRENIWVQSMAIDVSRVPLEQKDL